MDIGHTTSLEAKINMFDNVIFFLKKCFYKVLSDENLERLLKEKEKEINDLNTIEKTYNEKLYDGEEDYDDEQRFIVKEEKEAAVYEPEKE